jgi:hypothetical protein
LARASAPLITPPTPMMDVRAQRLTQARMTRLLASNTGAPDRPPASSACGRPCTASRAGGVGGDHAVHAVFLQRGGDDGDLRVVQVGRDLQEHRHAPAE